MKGYQKMSVEEFVRSAAIIRSGDRCGSLHVAKSDAREFLDAIKSRKSEIMAYLLAQETAQQQAADARAAKIAAIPGLRELQAAHSEAERYEMAFSRMMEDESNDGVCPPKAPTCSVSELSARYPRASAYLTAEDWSCASNYIKAGAGAKALERIINGEDHEQVLEDMRSEWSKYCEAHLWD